MNKEYFKEILENNGYINLSNVKEFLQNNYIADFEVIAEIFGGGLSELDYYDLQEALKEIEV